jgi:polyhydroxyalkanoate synthase
LRWLSALAAKPSALAGPAIGATAEVGRIAIGRSSVAPEKGDRRFEDPAWREHPAFRRLMQAYLLLSATANKTIDAAGLEDSDARAAHFVADLVADTLAPTNAFWSNPAAIKRAFDTGGMSVVRGARNLLHDLRSNGGMPAMVDSRPFEVGRNTAATPGAVVYRNDILELLQYTPSTKTIYETPVLCVPPQINKYYFTDLGPGRSFIEHSVASGIPYFGISWRNPTAEQREWNLDAYVQGCLDALDAVLEISGAANANILGFCAGGITAAATAGYLAAAGSAKVRGVTFVVTLFDTEVPCAITTFTSPALLERARRKSQSKGVLEGADLAKAFAWLRANDLVWNYWVNNYLLGNDPPAFDILAWNADTTRLPAGLHSDYLDLFASNPLLQPGGISVLGKPLDLRRVEVPAYVVCAINDHLVPWQSGYMATKALGGPTEFVLSAFGHIQSLVNPPGNPKSWYLVEGPLDGNAEEWRAGARTEKGSWWEHWTGWVGKHSGEQRPAPRKLGSRVHPALEPAPGTYVLER